MKYKCKLIVRNNLYDGIMSDFKIILKYKKEGKLFYEKLEIFNAWCCLHSEYTKNTLVPQLKVLSEMSEEEFMKLIKDKLIKTLGLKETDNKDYEQLEESIKILQSRSKEFFIEI